MAFLMVVGLFFYVCLVFVTIVFLLLLRLEIRLKLSANWIIEKFQGVAHKIPACNTPSIAGSNDNKGRKTCLYGFHDVPEI